MDFDALMDMFIIGENKQDIDIRIALGKVKNTFRERFRDDLADALQCCAENILNSDQNCHNWLIAFALLISKADLSYRQRFEFTRFLQTQATMAIAIKVGVRKVDAVREAEQRARKIYGCEPDADDLSISMAATNLLLHGELEAVKKAARYPY